MLVLFVVLCVVCALFLWFCFGEFFVVTKCVIFKCGVFQM